MTILCYMDGQPAFFNGWNGYQPTWTRNKPAAAKANAGDFRQLRRMGYQVVEAAR